MKISEIINKSFSNSIDTMNKSFDDEKLIHSIGSAATKIIETYKSKGKVMLAGNGGSAADCQHVCAELVGRLNFDRSPLSAVALTVDTSNLTCIANDYGYDHVFARQMEAIAQSNDTLMVYTTSGSSKNILLLIEKARKRVKNIISLTGLNTKDLEKYSDVVISVNSSTTTRIQEVHALIGHILCECVEETLFKR